MEVLLQNIGDILQSIMPTISSIIIVVVGVLIKNSYNKSMYEMKFENLKQVENFKAEFKEQFNNVKSTVKKFCEKIDLLEKSQENRTQNEVYIRDINKAFDSTVDSTENAGLINLLGRLHSLIIQETNKRLLEDFVNFNLDVFDQRINYIYDCFMDDAKYYLGLSYTLDFENAIKERVKIWKLDIHEIFESKYNSKKQRYINACLHNLNKVLSVILAKTQK